MKIVVIMPTYNEKVNTEKMIPVLEEEVFPKVNNHQIYLLVADDKSPDGTADVVRKAMNKWKNIDMLVGHKEGLGAAYIRAMRYAMEKMRADAVIEFDADFQHDPNDIPRLIAAMDKGYDYIIGSRYIPGGAIPKEWGFHRKFISYFGGMFARVVLWDFKIHDMTSGYKLTKTKYLEKVDLEHLYSKYYAYKMHILHDVVKLGARVKEVPIIFYERKEGSSKIEKKDLLDSFSVVIRLRLHDSARMIKFLIVGGTGFIVQLLFQELSIRLGTALTLAVGLSSIINIFVRHTDLLSLSQGVGAGIGAEAAILSNFFLNNFWTFQDTHHITQSSNTFIRLLKFNLTSLASIFLQFFAVWAGVKLLGNYVLVLDQAIPTRILILFPTIIFLVIPLNYLIYNKLIWKTQYLKHGNDKTV